MKESEPIEKNVKHKTTIEIIKQRLRIGLKSFWRLFHPAG